MAENKDKTDKELTDKQIATVAKTIEEKKDYPADAQEAKPTKKKSKKVIVKNNAPYEKPYENPFRS